MSFPKTEAELIAAGYKFDRTAVCSGRQCHREIEWWITPAGKRMPLDPGTMEPHFATCPDAPQFRRKASTVSSRA